MTDPAPELPDKEPPAGTARIEVEYKHGRRLRRIVVEGSNADPHQFILAYQTVFKLHSGSPSERAAAEEELLSCGEEAVEALRIASEVGARQWTAHRRVVLAFGIVSLLLITASVVGGSTIGAFTSLISLPGLVYQLVVMRQYKVSVARLAECVEDPRLAGVLAEALFFRDRTLASASCAAMVRLLPQLTPADERDMLPSQRMALFHALRYPDEALVLALLEAVGRAGDVEAAQYVQPLAAGHGTGSNPLVQTRAQACLAALQEGMKRQAPGAALLRPAAEPAAPPGLLRPAANVEGVQEALLRPSESGEDR